METMKGLNNDKADSAKEISIVYITDRNFFPNICISAYSIKRNRNHQFNYHVYVITDQVPEKETEVLYQLETERFQIHLISAATDLRGFDRIIARISEAACIKFQLAELLPALERVLYLDGDTIVQTDLSELFNVNIEDVYAAAVRDPTVENVNTSVTDKLEKYFNSGMLLLNLRKIREDNIQKMLIDYRLNGVNYFMDQDALNVVFAGKVRYLSARFNYLICMIYYAGSIKFPADYGYDSDITEYERICHADIVHLSGAKKAWKEYIPYATELFMNYYTASPFRTVFKFRPQTISQRYIFPFADIPKGVRVAIWGAGRVGQEFYRQLHATNFCEVVCVIDGCPERYNRDENTWKGLREVLNPEKLRDFEFDYIIIAVINEQIAKDIMENIRLLCPFDKKKIFWKVSVYLS